MDWTLLPNHLLLNNRIKPIPHFFSIIIWWELPESLTHFGFEYGISEVQDIHADEIETNEIQKQVLNLVTFDSNTDEIS